MTVTEFVETASPTLRRYVSEMANALQPGDGKELEKGVWARLSLMPGDRSGSYLLKAVAEIMLEKTEARSPEIRRARGVFRKYFSDGGTS